jgi:hypothetical protein
MRRMFQSFHIRKHRVENCGDIQSIMIMLQGPIQLTLFKSAVPYTLFEDKNGDFYSKVLLSGSYMVSAQAFSAPHASGLAREIESVTFTISQLWKWYITDRLIIQVIASML